MKNINKPSAKELIIANKQFLTLIGIAIAFYVFSFSVSSTRFTSILHISSFMTLAALGQTLVFLIAGIDLSVASLLSASAILFTTLLNDSVPFSLTIVIVIFCSALFGMINGLGVSFLKIPALVMTVATQYILRGITLIATNGKPISLDGEKFSYWVNRSFIGSITGGMFVMFLSVTLLMGLLYLTKFGREVRFFGSNEKVAFLSGVNIKKITILTYLIAAAFTGLTGIMLVGYTGTAAVRIGDSYLLPSIAAVLLGGTSPLGGKGNFVRTLVGAFILTNIVSLLTVFQMPEATRQIIQGFVVLVFIVINNTELTKKVIRRKGQKVSGEIS